jgi:UDP-N-acetylmuramoyl-L-alanyl-D-glutamate--2,6-diaminopimelate ligase
MQLKTLVESIPVQEIVGPLDREVDGIFYDSRRVQKNGLYVAVRGAHFDGHEFTEQAIERGASTIVVERPESHSRATSLVVANSRLALRILHSPFSGSRASAENGRRHRHERKDDDHVPPQTHL